MIVWPWVIISMIMWPCIDIFLWEWFYLVIFPMFWKCIDFLKIFDFFWRLCERESSYRWLCNREATYFCDDDFSSDFPYVLKFFVFFLFFFRWSCDRESSYRWSCNHESAYFCNDDFSSDFPYVLKILIFLKNLEKNRRSCDHDLTYFCDNDFSSDFPQGLVFFFFSFPRTRSHFWTLVYFRRQTTCFFVFTFYVFFFFTKSDTRYNFTMENFARCARNIEKKSRPREHKKSTQLLILNSYKKYDMHFFSKQKKTLSTFHKQNIKNNVFTKNVCLSFKYEHFQRSIKLILIKG